jgi:hypothetical protein
MVTLGPATNIVFEGPMATLRKEVLGLPIVMFAVVIIPIDGVPNAVRVSVAVVVVVLGLRLAVVNNVRVDVVVLVAVVVEVSVTECAISCGEIRIAPSDAASMMEMADNATILAPTPFRGEDTRLFGLRLA